MIKKFKYLLHCLYVIRFLKRKKAAFISDRKDGFAFGLCLYLSPYYDRLYKSPLNRLYKNPLNGKYERFLPEFTPEFFGKGWVFSGEYWWPKEDTESRLRAFDKLIATYKNKIKELI